jgi:hypothetical protein
MTLFEQFVVWRGEKHLKRYRQIAAGVSAQLTYRYQLHLPDIRQYYTKAAYWHGTGRYHYYHPSDSRYEGVQTERVVDVLESIITQGGLSAHQDLWVRINGEPLKTVSLSPTRMHSRLFAHVHLCDGEWLEYVFGGTRFWTGIIFALVIKDLLSNKSRHQRHFLKQAIFSGSFLQNAYTWAGALRNSGSNLPPVWRAYDLRSDIIGNHPLLFGLKKEAADTSGTIPFLRQLEVRVPGLISLEQITHVEVPQARVAEVQSLFSSKNIHLPIIPLEVGELYCSEMPLSKLIYV